MYDLAIIGAGAAGIACAKHALAAGLKTILLNKTSDSFGGTCLNKGCIPTKLFLNQSKLKISWSDTFTIKNTTIKNIQDSTLKFLQNSGLDIKWGSVSFINKNELIVDDVKIQAKNIVIATGSTPRQLIQHPKVIFAEDMFALNDIGNKFIIVGGGYIGIEFASLLNNFGKKVTVIEKEERILPFFDRYLATRLNTILSKKGIEIITGKNVNDCDLNTFDNIILSVGRMPETQNLSLDKAGVITEKNGWIKTDNCLKTNIDNIYACGDVNGKKLLAYTAEYQAQICIANINGENKEEDYQCLPECVFSYPALARVGILEDEAKQKNIKHKVIKSNFLKFSSSYVYNDLDGFIEILADENDRVIGAGIISNLAGELISPLTLAIKNNLTLKNLKDLVLIHPTLSEIIPLMLK